MHDRVGPPTWDEVITKVRGHISGQKLDGKRLRLDGGNAEDFDLIYLGEHDQSYRGRIERLSNRPGYWQVTMGQGQALRLVSNNANELVAFIERACTQS